MSFNFFYRPNFPANPSEDKLLSSIRISNGYIVDGNPEKNGDDFAEPQIFNWEINDSHDCKKERGERGGSFEPISNDILDLLPSDPFGMEISATFTAFTGWLEGFEADYEECSKDEGGAIKGDCHLIAGLNFVLNRAMKFQAEPENPEVGDRLNGSLEEKEVMDASCDYEFISVCNVEEFLSFGDEDTRVVGCHAKESRVGTESCSDMDGGAPHDAILFCLRYLDVQDLLSVQKVCRTFRSAVQTDSLLWRSLQIDQPLSERLTDDRLLGLTSRADGKLRCLSLVDCLRITDDGLRRVLESNPKLAKLYVLGCTRLSIEGIITNLKAFKSSSTTGIRHLRIGGLYGVRQEHFEELKLLLGEENFLPKKVHKPRYYHIEYSSLSCDDDPALDIESCPRCQSLRLIYDCPAESCQGKLPETQVCRACTLCIARCVKCGRCINDREYEETFCLDLLCSDCLKELLKGQETTEEENSGSSKHTIVHHEMRYHFHVYG